MKHLTLLLAGTALWLAACAPAEEPVEPTPEPEVTETEAPASEPVVETETDVLIEPSALTAPGRTDEDMARDADRKPVETLEFIGIEPGMTVMEMEAGGGYFTPFLAYAAGPEGTVYMQNPEVFRQFFGGAEKPPRFESLPDTVEYLEADFDDLSSVPDGTIDIVTWMQGPHEIWYAPEGMTEQLADPDITFEEIARVLKPGGVFVALDHNAPTGTAESSGGDTHRIDQNVIDKLAASKGLEKTETSDLFANPDDDMTTNVFDPSIRGKTNQFFVKYTKSAD